MLGLRSLQAFLRDMLPAEVPMLFRAELYATASVVPGGAYVSWGYWRLREHLVSLFALAISLALRLAAIRFRGSLAKFFYARD